MAATSLKSRIGAALDGAEANIDVSPYDMAGLDFTQAVSRRIGGGGFGEVFEVGYFHMPAALKLPFVNFVDLPDDIRKLFNREMSMHQMLKHPNIITLLGVSVLEGRILMELADCSFDSVIHDKRCPKHTQFTADIAIHVMRQISSGLSYLHGLDVLHRDLKPANILIFNDWTAKLSDFGMAGVVAASQRITKCLGGTPSYMAPELFRRPPLYGKPQDIYAMSLILNESLTRSPPFNDQEDYHQIVFASTSGHRPALVGSIHNEGIAEMGTEMIQRAAGLIQAGWDQEPANRPDVERFRIALHAIPSPAFGDVDLTDLVARNLMEDFAGDGSDDDDDDDDEDPVEDDDYEFEEIPEQVHQGEIAQPKLNIIFVNAPIYHGQTPAQIQVPAIAKRRSAGSVSRQSHPTVTVRHVATPRMSQPKSSSGIVYSGGRYRNANGTFASKAAVKSAGKAWKNGTKKKK